MSGKPTGKVERQARLRWVPLSKVRVNPLAQREINEARVDKLASDFDPEQFGTPTVNMRGEHFYVIDGQHRIEALRRWFGDGQWENQQIQCWTYEGMSESEEAEAFLKLNDTLAVVALAKFRVSVQAGRPEESDVDRIVRAQGLRVTRDKGDGAIGAVGTLMRIYRRADGVTLGRTLRIIRDAYGDPGLEAPVIDGIGLLCQRYNGELEDKRAVERLSGVHGGVNGLLGRAETLRKQTGNARNHCVAAAAVDIINAGRGGKKLPSWWKE
ncbi:MAG TPA: DUF6551 family protein [Micromonosporaceae bacterium]